MAPAQRAQVRRAGCASGEGDRVVEVAALRRLTTAGHAAVRLTCTHRSGHSVARNVAPRSGRSNGAAGVGHPRSPAPVCRQQSSGLRRDGTQPRHLSGVVRHAQEGLERHDHLYVRAKRGTACRAGGRPWGPVRGSTLGSIAGLGVIGFRTSGRTRRPLTRCSGGSGGGKAKEQIDEHVGADLVARPRVIRVHHPSGDGGQTTMDAMSIGLVEIGDQDCHPVLVWEDLHPAAGERTLPC